MCAATGAQKGELPAGRRHRIGCARLSIRGANPILPRPPGWMWRSRTSLDRGRRHLTLPRPNIRPRRRNVSLRLRRSEQTHERPPPPRPRPTWPRRRELRQQLPGMPSEPTPRRQSSFRRLGVVSRSTQTMMRPRPSSGRRSGVAIVEGRCRSRRWTRTRRLQAGRRARRSSRGSSKRRRAAARRASSRRRDAADQLEAGTWTDRYVVYTCESVRLGALGRAPTNVNGDG